MSRSPYWELVKATEPRGRPAALSGAEQRVGPAVHLQLRERPRNNTWLAVAVRLKRVNSL